ncbi:DUF2188 domain-containing protein [Dethiothermospora halolimnae]|uniref:DUF2188 domain-containing protein n=1 Tax=Dethiothermospora halolimnae TaxID=3114390 RepID=UPI003CCC44E8
MSKRNKYWVVWKSLNSKWQVKREKSSTVLKNFDTKQEAVDYGVKVARNNQPSQLTIKRKNGTIEDERTYGNDPFPPRG